MGEGQSKQEDGELVLVALEGEVANLDKLVTLARECGFRKLLSALVKDLHRAQAEVVEIIAMAAADEPRATAAEGAEAAARPDEIAGFPERDDFRMKRHRALRRGRLGDGAQRRG